MQTQALRESIYDLPNLPASIIVSLARPFDSHVHYQPNHHDIAMDLISAACEITGSSEAMVATPIKEKGDQGRHPITFLIHNLTQLEVHTLLSRPVWSSNVITFQVSLLHYCRNVRPTWVKFNSKDTKESEWCSRF